MRVIKWLGAAVIVVGSISCGPKGNDASEKTEPAPKAFAEAEIAFDLREVESAERGLVSLGLKFKFSVSRSSLARRCDWDAAALNAYSNMSTDEIKLLRIHGLQAFVVAAQNVLDKYAGYFAKTNEAADLPAWGQSEKEDLKLKLGLSARTIQFLQ